MRETKLFLDRHSKHLQKKSHGPTTIMQNLDDWFCRYKVTSSDPTNSPAGGRLDPLRQVPLFTADTKDAVSNCKLKAQHIEDQLPLDQMHDLIEANPNGKHSLKPASLPVDQNDICICNMCCSNSNNKTIINNKSNEQINIATVENKNTGDKNINRQEARRPAERVQHDNTNPSPMPQQHAHQQPCFATTPVPTVGVNCYQQFQPMPAFLPTMLHQHVPQQCFAPAVCCSSYQKWLCKRKGRPPHDLRCYTKCNNAMLVQQQMMGCGWPTPGGG